jgi:hypothetical protein
MAGTIYRYGDHWVVRISLPGGKKSKPVHLPPDIGEEQARTAADAMHRRAREKLAAAKAKAPEQSCDAYAERVFAHREAIGYTGTRQDLSRWKTWASPVIGTLITLLTNVLGGELTTRFVLKTLTVLSISGSIFGYYLTDLKRAEEQQKS